MQHCSIANLQCCTIAGLLDRPAGCTSWTDQLDRPTGQISWTDQLDGSAGRISWTDQLDGSAGWSAGQISWTDQLDGSAGRISSLYLKPWPVRIFEDSLFSLYIVAASESDEGLVYLSITCSEFFRELSFFFKTWNHEQVFNKLWKCHEQVIQKSLKRSE